MDYSWDLYLVSVPVSFSSEFVEAGLCLLSSCLCLCNRLLVDCVWGDGNNTKTAIAGHCDAPEIGATCLSLPVRKSVTGNVPDKKLKIPTSLVFKIFGNTTSVTK